MILHKERLTGTPASGSLTLKTQRISFGHVTSIYIKATTGSTTFNYSITDEDGDVITNDNGTGTYQRDVAFMIRGIWTIAITSASADEAFVVALYIDNSKGSSGSSLAKASGGSAVTVAAGATSMVKTEDSASADGDAGAAMLAVRKATPANTSGADGDYEFLQMSAGRLWTSSTVTAGTIDTVTNLSQMGGVAIALGAGATSTGTQRVVQANGGGKTILSAGGSASSSGNNTLVAAGTNRLKVLSFSLTTVSATAMTCIFQSGASGTELWRCVIMAPSGASAGANLSTTVPSWLFATASATLLNLNLSSANAVHWSVSYVDEA